MPNRPIRSPSERATRSGPGSRSRKRTTGTTSAAPTRGWTPSWAPRSIRSAAAAIPASRPSTSPSASPTHVNTERLWSASAWTSSTRACRSIAPRIAVRTSRSRPTEKFGTASMSPRMTGIMAAGILAGGLVGGPARGTRGGRSGGDERPTASWPRARNVPTKEDGGQTRGSVLQSGEAGFPLSGDSPVDPVWDCASGPSSTEKGGEDSPRTSDEIGQPVADDVVNGSIKANSPRGEHAKPEVSTGDGSAAETGNRSACGVRTGQHDASGADPAGGTPSN